MKDLLLALVTRDVNAHAYENHIHLSVVNLCTANENIFGSSCMILRSADIVSLVLNALTTDF